MRAKASLLIVVAMSLVGCTGRSQKVSSPPATTQLYEWQTESKTWTDKPLAAHEVRAICDTVLLDVLTNEQFASSRNFYGTPDDSHVYVTTDTGYIPKLPIGWQSGEPLRDRAKEREWPNVLGVAIEHVAATTRPVAWSHMPADATLQVSIYNAGGIKTTAVMGYTSVSYRALRTAAGWTVRWILISS